MSLMVELPPVLTHQDAGACVETLRQALSATSDPVWVVDARALSRFDSSALAVLLACRRDAEARQRRFVVQGLPPKLRQLAVLYGVAELLPEVS
jgi:phospholipid transport system transporter-binding protein